MKNNFNDQIKQMTDKELLQQLYVTQFLMLAISIMSRFLSYKGDSFWTDINWFDFNVVTIGISAGIIVVCIDIFFMKWLPDDYYDDGGINERIFRNQRVFQIAALTMLVAFSEEMLFRGLIQARLGLFWASIIFAAIHVRYLFNWFLFINIVLLSFLIGVIFIWTDNLAVTIVMHFVIDFLLGLQIRLKTIKKETGRESP